MMRTKLEHTANEAKFWKAQDFIKRLLALVVLVICAPLTIYIGIQAVSGFLNRIRDWWHYVETSPNPDAWLYLGLFIAAGMGWLFTYHYLNDPLSKTQRFEAYIREKRRIEARLEEKREREMARERTRWDKIKDGFFIAYGILMAAGIVAFLIMKALD